MKRSWISIFVFGAVLGLFGALAVLQYVWLKQIGDTERERLQTRLQTDADLFAADFNRQLRVAYFIFQIDPQDWLEKDWTKFNDRYKLWQLQTAYPKLVKDFYFVAKDALPLRYDADAQTFDPVEFNEELLVIKNKIAANEAASRTAPIQLDAYTLLMPNYASDSETEKPAENSPLIKLNPSGYVVIKLDAETISRMLDDLTARYFPANEPSHFNVSIFDKSSAKIVYPANQNALPAPDTSDVSVSLFDLSNTNLRVSVNRRVFVVEKSADQNNVPKNSPVVVLSKNDRVKVQMTDGSKALEPLIADTGFWLLHARHADGSLENYVNRTRYANLAISFGILLLLAASIVLIFTSARRAQRFAQQQVDFVSAVSHEFRTPLAVIRLAGENLTDGIVDSRSQIERYGNLIKGEGRKLSAMVEQILEFAGAGSGKRKYDFRQTNVRQVIENALADCEPLIKEKGFVVVTEIAENLPKISADEKALGQAIQNLIANSVKYSNGHSWLKISAVNDDGKVKIAIEDKGIGIAPKDLRHVFEPFYRSKSVVDEQIHGNGLGLSLVKQTVAAHGGKITVESKIGRGSVFTLHLPFNI